MSFCLKTSTEEANQSVCKCIMLNVSNRAKVTADWTDERQQRGSFVLSVFGLIDKVSPDLYIFAARFWLNICALFPNIV